MWDKNWDDVYRMQGYRARYPNEDLIRFLARFYKGKEAETKVLDLGCGSCNHVYWLAKEGFKVWGIDGSEKAIKMGLERLQTSCLNANVGVGDFTKLPFENDFFDLVIDVCSIQHNKFKDIMTIFSEVYRVIKPGGRFFSILRSSKDYYFKDEMDKMLVESHTFTGFKEGDLIGVGIIHFFHIEEIKHLLKHFIGYNIETTERTIDRTMDNNVTDSIVHFVVRAQK